MTSGALATRPRPVALLQTLLDDNSYVCIGSNPLAVDGQVGPETWSHIWFVD